MAQTSRNKLQDREHGSVTMQDAALPLSLRLYFRNRHNGLPDNEPSFAISALEIGTKSGVNAKAIIRMPVILFMAAFFQGRAFDVCVDSMADMHRNKRRALPDMTLTMSHSAKGYQVH
jgi:hypothetical protein